MEKRWNNDDEFKLEFIKYYPEVAKKYRLSPTEALLFWLIITVIEFQAEINNNPVCFMSSKTMAKHIWKKTWSIDNAIKKLKDKWLIEIRNKYMYEYNRNSRYIYKPWTLKRTWWKVTEFFDKHNMHCIERFHETEAIIWDILYKYNYTFDDLNQLLARLIKKYKTDSDELDDTFLRILYKEDYIIFRPFANKEDLIHKEAWGLNPF